jgi:hypothetical protein
MSGRAALTNETSDDRIGSACSRSGSPTGVRPMPATVATFGVSPAVMRLVPERQSRGEIPAGDIVGVMRVR